MDHVKNLGSGINQAGVRAFNERLLLSLLQRNGPQPGSLLARQTGLSPQTSSVILRKLENDGLIRREEPVRGKVGKPSVPFRVAEDGLFSIGMKIGRRTAEILLLDFGGNVRDQLRLSYDYPMPDPVFGFLKTGIHDLTNRMPPDDQHRICGLGIAAPFELWNWHELVGAPEQEYQAWRDVDVAEQAAGITDMPVEVVNDGTAACRAEHLFGRGKSFRDYAYFFLGAFIGGGVALDHAVFQGNRGNAGAFGPMPSLRAGQHAGQLVDRASIHNLERRVLLGGRDPKLLWTQPQDWSPFKIEVDQWLTQTANELALASVAACSVIDFEAVLIDGAMPVDVRRELVRRTSDRLDVADMRGIHRPEIVEAEVGGNARTIGAAVGPMLSGYLLDRASTLFDAG